MIQLIKLEVSELDARAFVEFQKNYDLFSQLAKHTDMQFGKIILNIAHGQVQNVIREEMVFKKII